MKKSILLLTTSIILTCFVFVNAKAQIVYTDVNPDTTIVCPYDVPYGGDSSNYFYFDLNLDDTLDFRVKAQHYNFFDGVNWRDVFHILVIPLNNNKCGDRFEVNNVIDSTGSWGDYHIINDFWPFLSEAYVGLKLIKNSQTYYGWVRLDWFHSIKVTIKDYAYNTVPNQSIQAGQITGIQETIDTNIVNIYVSGKSVFVQIIDGSTPSGTISIYNIMGQQVKTENISSSLNQVVMTGFSTGTYIVHVSFNNTLFIKSINIE